MRAILLAVAMLTLGAIPAFALGQITTLGASGIFGDVDCDGAVNAVDALKILRHTAGLTVTQNEPCQAIGTAESTPTPAPTSTGEATPTPTQASTPTPTPTASPTPTPTQAQGRLIDGLVLTGIGGGLYRSQLVDVSDCAAVSILAKQGFLSNTHYSSPDGVEFVAVWLEGNAVRVDVPYTTSSLNNAPVALPFLAVLVDTGAGWQPEAWIWCAF